MSAIIQAYWPVIYLFGGLCFASYFPRIKRLPGYSWRLSLYWVGVFCLLYTTGSLAAAYIERSGGGYPFAYPAIGKLSASSILWALGWCSLSCWVASRIRIRYGLWLNVGALYLLLNAIHLLIPSQGSLCEMVGLFTARRMATDWITDATEGVSPSTSPIVSHGLTTLAIRHNQQVTWLFDGIGPWFKLQLPKPIYHYSLHRKPVQH